MFLVRVGGGQGSSAERSGCQARARLMMMVVMVVVMMMVVMMGQLL